MERLIVNLPHEYLNEKCQTHQVNLVSVNGRRAFCPECARIAQERQSLVWAQEESEKFKERHLYGWLLRFSLCPDRTIMAASIDTFIASSSEDRAVWASTKNKITDYKMGRTFNLIFSGKSGAGKSHLAMSVLKELNDTKSFRCLFVAFDELLLKIRESYNGGGETEQELMQRLADCHYLVLDDVGAETGHINTSRASTDFANKVLYRVLNERQGKSTIVTTNLNKEQLSAMYDEKTISRMYRKAKVVPMWDNEDKRSRY